MAATSTSTSTALVCPKGHTMVPRTWDSLMEQNPGYEEGFTCDQCHITTDRKGSTIQSIMHCCGCQFDLCADCIAKGHGSTATVSRRGVNDSLADSVNSFGITLLGAFSQGNTDNVFVSPYSISQILSLVSTGAVGVTQAEMISTLCIPSNLISSLATFYTTTNGLLRACDSEVLVANSTWIKTGYSFTPAFQRQCAGFNTEAFPLPLSAEPVNTWCSAKTKGRIPTILDTIPPLTALILINALYFKGLFTQPFEPRNTFPKNFTTAAGNTIRVQMMSKDSPRFLYHETKTFQAVKLGYGTPRSGPGPSLCCVVVLPKPKNTIQELLEDASSMVSGFSQMAGVLEMPKFRLEWSHDLKTVLKTMGMQTAFSNGAQFGALCSPDDVYISSVIHKTFVEVNESGTEAAAVTAVVLKTKSMPSRPAKSFHMLVDRPFLFFILEESTQAILFGGVINAPNAV
ncbi:serine protease inhibitor [Pelomyxa schiedti]|nr:serine protease inhibitor [Pelomyxa schiedti]